MTSLTGETQIGSEFLDHAIYFWRKRWKQFGLLSILFSLAIWWVVRPTQRLASTDLRVYTAYSSLLLPAGRSVVLGKYVVSTDYSELNLALADENLFRHFLEKQRVYEKIAQRLQKKDPELALMARSCNIMPAQVSGEESIADKVESLNPATAQEQQLSDYATLQSQEQQQNKQRRINRILLSATARSSADAQQLVMVTVKVLQEELSEVAVRKARSERRQIEDFIKVSSNKVKKATQSLNAQPELEPEQVEQMEQKIQLLSMQQRRLSLECLDLKKQIAYLSEQDESLSDSKSKEVKAADQPPSLQQTLTTLETQLHQLALIYQPGSHKLSSLRQQLEVVQAFAHKVQQATGQQRTSALSAQLKAKQELLLQVQSELQLLLAQRSPLEQRRQFAQRQRELSTWEAELEAWELQLVQARLAEKICLEQGTAVVLQAALPGVAVPFLQRPFFQTYSQCFKKLPLAPLMAFLCVLLLEIFNRVRRIDGRARDYLDVPVLAQLPALPAEYCRRWQQIKAGGDLWQRENHRSK